MLLEGGLTLYSGLGNIFKKGVGVYKEGMEKKIEVVRIHNKS